MDGGREGREGVLPYGLGGVDEEHLSHGPAEETQRDQYGVERQTEMPHDGPVEEEEQEQERQAAHEGAQQRRGHGEHREAPVAGGRGTEGFDSERGTQGVRAVAQRGRQEQEGGYRMTGDEPPDEPAGAGMPGRQRSPHTDGHHGTALHDLARRYGFEPFLSGEPHFRQLACTEDQQRGRDQPEPGGQVRGPHAGGQGHARYDEQQHQGREGTREQGRQPENGGRVPVVLREHQRIFIA